MRNLFPGFPKFKVWRTRLKGHPDTPIVFEQIMSKDVYAWRMTCGNSLAPHLKTSNILKGWVDTPDFDMFRKSLGACMEMRGECLEEGVLAAISSTIAAVLHKMATMVDVFTDRNEPALQAQQPPQVGKIALLGKRIMRQSGGHGILYQPELGDHYYGLLVRKGRVFRFTHKKLVPPQYRTRRSCWFGVGRYYADIKRTDGDDTKIWLGFGLAKDGLWYAHGWMSQGDTLIEPTTYFVKYWGAQVTEEELWKTMFQ